MFTAEQCGLWQLRGQLTFKTFVHAHTHTLEIVGTVLFNGLDTLVTPASALIKVCTENLACFWLHEINRISDITSTLNSDE